MNTFLRKRNHLPHKSLYQGSNWYFVTVCIQDRKCVFEIKTDEIFSNDTVVLGNGDTVVLGNGDTVVLGNGDTVVLGNGDTVVASTAKITNICVEGLYNLIEMYENIFLDKWVIMPNHIHFIIGFDGQPISKITNKNANLGDIIKSFKLYTQRKIIVEATTVSPFPTKTTVSPFPKTTVSPFPKTTVPLSNFNYHKFWQKSYYDHIIRDEKDLDRVREYITNNPANWSLDKLNPLS